MDTQVSNTIPDNMNNYTLVQRIFKKLPNRKISLSIVGVLILLLGVIIITLWLSQNKKPVKSEIFPPEKPIVKVGNETIYGSTLNQIATQNILQNPSTNTDEIKHQSLQQAQTQSIIIQGGLKSGYIQQDQLTSQNFNSPTASENIRQDIVNQVTEKVLSAQPISQIELISTWYYNTRPPQIPQSQATAYARDLITKLRNDIVAGRSTFIQAANIIRSDQTMAKIDQSYQANAYLKQPVSLNNSNSILDDSQIDNFVRSSSTGSISAVLDTHPAKLEPGIQAYFTVVKILSKDNTNSQSFSDWLNQQTQQFQITNL